MTLEAWFSPGCLNRLSSFAGSCTSYFCYSLNLAVNNITEELFVLHNSESRWGFLSQEPAPMTEDALEEQSEVLAKLGTSAEGAHLRARMQSACLLSDMESFKVRIRNFCNSI